MENETKNSHRKTSLGMPVSLILDDGVPVINPLYFSPADQ